MILYHPKVSVPTWYLVKLETPEGVKYEFEVDEGFVLELRKSEHDSAYIILSYNTQEIPVRSRDLLEAVLSLVDEEVDVGGADGC